jgi:hypothetical protein
LALSFFTNLIFLSQECNFSEKPVAEMMGHSTSQVTEHYLASLDLDKMGDK